MRIRLRRRGQSFFPNFQNLPYPCSCSETMSFDLSHEKSEPQPLVGGRQAFVGRRKSPCGFHLFLPSSKELLHTAFTAG